MAIVNDSYIIELERQRAELLQILKDKEVEVEDDETLQSLIKKVNKIGTGGLIRSLLDGTITEYTDETIESVIAYGIYGKSSLVKIDLPNCTHVGTCGIRANSALKTLLLPNLLNATGEAFNGNSKLSELIIPKAYLSSANYMFMGCTSLKIVDCFKIVMQTSCFGGCSNLENLIFRDATTLSSLNNLSNMPSTTPVLREGTKGYIYVPKNLVENYKVATNWSVYANKFRAIEDWAENIEINTQPTDITAAVDEQITFDVDAEGMVLKYQWEMSSDGGNTWSESTTNSSKTASYVVNVRQNYDGYKVRCKITNHEGYSIYSDVATLTVTE